MPAHMSANPTDPNMVWDQNSGRWIQKPGTQIPLGLAQSGFMQTPWAQQGQSDVLGGTGQSDALSYLQGQGAAQPMDRWSQLYRPPTPPTAKPATAQPNVIRSSSDLAPQTTVPFEGATGPQRANPRITMHDAEVPDWTRDATSGWVAPLGTANNNQAFPDIATGQSYMQNDWGMNQPGYAAPTVGTADYGGPSGGMGGSPSTSGNVDDYSMFGLGNWDDVPGEQLGEMPTMSSTWNPGFEGSYFQTAENVRNRIGDIYGFQTPQTDLGGVPQPGAQGTDQFAALQFLLSGKGFDDPTLARMHAMAGDSAAAGNAARMSSSRIAAQRAGLGDSGVSVALQDQAGRENAAGLNTAHNAIEVQNALQGAQNRVTGAGMELNRGQANAQNANQMALANAANMLSAMQQNTQNMFNQGMAGAGAQAGVMSSAGNAFNQATLNQATQANQQNAANAFNWRQNQAGMNQQNNQFNQSQRQNRWTTGVNNMTSLANNTNPNYNAGSQLLQQVQPYSAIGSTISQVGQRATGAV